jgi:low temperature requirement protein LtrA
MNRSQALTLFGGIILIFSLFLPWATHTAPSLNLRESINGYSTDGVFTGLFGLIIILISVVLKGTPEKRYSYIVSFIALIAFAATLRTITSVGTVIRDSADIITSIQIGAYASLLGALVSFLGGLMKVPPSFHEQKTMPPR